MAQKETMAAKVKNGGFRYIIHRVVVPTDFMPYAGKAYRCPIKILYAITKENGTIGGNVLPVVQYCPQGGYMTMTVRNYQQFFCSITHPIFLLDIIPQFHL
jgi:hypothetical protein